MSTPRPFAISKEVVYQAYLRVKANKGAAGVDEQSVEEFARDLAGNLYKLWCAFRRNGSVSPEFWITQPSWSSERQRRWSPPTPCHHLLVDDLAAVCHHVGRVS